MKKITEFLKRLNPEELTIGFLYPLMFVYWLKWWCLLCCPISSIFWAMSGAQGFDKFWRRELCPVVVGLPLWILVNWGAVIGTLMSFAVQSIGYGLPSTQPPDPGSALGRFCWKIAKGNEYWANVLTRSILYIVLYLVFVLPMFIGAHVCLKLSIQLK